MTLPGGLSRETEAFPVVQRTSIRLFRRVTRFWVSLFRDVGRRTYFVRDIGRALGDPATRFEIHQGHHVGRPSRLLVEVPRAGGIRVSGTVARIPG